MKRLFYILMFELIVALFSSCISSRNENEGNFEYSEDEFAKYSIASISVPFEASSIWFIKNVDMVLEKVIYLEKNADTVYSFIIEACYDKEPYFNIPENGEITIKYDNKSKIFQFIGMNNIDRDHNYIYTDSYKKEVLSFCCIQIKLTKEDFIDIAKSNKIETSNINGLLKYPTSPKNIDILLGIESHIHKLVFRNLLKL
jgi:hypothetical protein